MQNIKKIIYHLSESEHTVLKKPVQDLLSQGLMCPSLSTWGAPALFENKKKNSVLRFCIDYPAFHKPTIKNSYPLSCIKDLCDRFIEAKIFSKIDFRSEYYQIRLAEEAIEKAALNTRYGHCEFLALTYGLTKRPATFMTLMNEIFHDFLDKIVKETRINF